VEGAMSAGWGESSSLSLSHLSAFGGIFVDCEWIDEDWDKDCDKDAERDDVSGIRTSRRGDHSSFKGTEGSVSLAVPCHSLRDGRTLASNGCPL